MASRGTVRPFAIAALVFILAQAHGPTCFALKPRGALFTLKGHHTDTVRSVAFSPDGKRARSGG